MQTTRTKRAISIHLMLMLIRKAFVFGIRQGISIHLMLMLIEIEDEEITLDEDFNTSHVNVNRGNCRGKRTCVLISIHLMLMLITSD